MAVAKRKKAVRGEGRQRLLEAARELFAAKPYAEVSTKAIAERAGVTEPMLFRHFETKLLLFEEAAFAPFSAFLEEFIADWESRPRGEQDPLDEARDLYRGLYTVLADNRQLVKALITTSSGGPPLGGILETFEPLTVTETEVHRFRTFDPKVLTHLIFAMAFAIAIHGDWLTAGSDEPPPDVDAYIEEMATLTVHGLHDI